jgi:hypothetical protein
MVTVKFNNIYGNLYTAEYKADRVSRWTVKDGILKVVGGTSWETGNDATHLARPQGLALVSNSICMLLIQTTIVFKCLNLKVAISGVNNVETVLTHLFCCSSGVRVRR